MNCVFGLVKVSLQAREVIALIVVKHACAEQCFSIFRRHNPEEPGS